MSIVYMLHILEKNACIWKWFASKIKIYIYQLDTSKSSNSKCVYDVEVWQVQVEEEGILCIVPA